MENISSKLSLLKKTSLSALIGHGVALVFLFLSSTLLVKNEDPRALMPAVALIAFFIGAAICGVIAGKITSSPLGGVIAGAIFVLLLIVVSLLLNAFLPADTAAARANYGVLMKIGLLAGSVAFSSLFGLLVNKKVGLPFSHTKRHKKARVGKR